MIRIDERLPEAALDSEVVLHVRRHLRAAIRTGAPSAPADLAHLFGFARSEGNDRTWIEATASREPIRTGAELAARRLGQDRVVSLGHDAAHVAECKRWLAERKRGAGDAAFARIHASDLATLLELSKARDLAGARSIGEHEHERFLPILIQGPTGTGKELLAEAIHLLWKQAANRPKASLHVVQVAGLPADMVYDELFGHARGAFTGASTPRKGRLEEADGETLLIDEVGDLPREAQVALLRFLQTQTLSRAGANAEQRLSVRILAATWRDLDAEVRSGRFREDLLHRLRVGALVLPPLARREGFFDEILPELLRARRHTAVPMIARSARDALAAHGWPGNLRELVGVLDTALAYATSDTIRVEHLPPPIQRRYLALPLHERALGFLLDEVDGQALVPEHVAWRIAELERSLEQLTPPPPNEQLATIGRFLSLLDDSSEQHKQSVAEVNRLLDLERTRGKAMAAEAFWRNVRAANLPPDVAEQIEGAARAANERQRTAAAEIAATQKNELIEANPWLRLRREIGELPLMRGADEGQLSNAFLSIFGLVKSFAPHFIDEISETMRTGGLAKVLEKLRGAKDDDEDNDGDEDEDGDAAPAPAPEPPRIARSPLALPPFAVAPARPQRPGRLTRKDWLAIVQRYPTQRAAVEATRFDPKTIAKYLKKHRIANPWAADR
jgi:hypothetical protein